ncbi:MAG TPA: hypothetical protein VH413_09910 [Verrucomicrobiae bacterium]|nr:hypothetical protein [Verrucomicrobiae bacterium]
MALGMSAVTLASAQTVYLTGSTAFRGNVFTALSTDNIVFHPAPAVTTYGGKGSGSTFMAFVGTPKGGSGTLTVLCDWSGSEAGISDVATPGGASEAFPNPPYDGLNDAGNPTTFTHAVDIAMADNNTQFSRIYGFLPNPPAALTSKTEVGIVTFKWVRNKGLWTGSNVTDSQIRQALNLGGVQAVFSGNSADNNNFVYVSGRDNSSGTRVNAFGNTEFGIFGVPSQIEISTGGAMQDLNPPNGTYFGDFGFSSGGTLAGTMGADTTTATDQIFGGTGFSVIAYLGVSDAATALTAGATELSYNGVPFSVANVEEGTYTFWGNEYICEKNGAVAPATTVFSQLAGATGIASTIPVGGGSTPSALRLTDMHTSRPGPTGDPAHN